MTSFLLAATAAEQQYPNTAPIVANGVWRTCEWLINSAADLLRAFRNQPARQ
jgi:hypothetical protein